MWSFQTVSLIQLPKMVVVVVVTVASVHCVPPVGLSGQGRVFSLLFSTPAAHHFLSLGPQNPKVRLTLSTPEGRIT